MGVRLAATGMVLSLLAGVPAAILADDLGDIIRQQKAAADKFEGEVRTALDDAARKVRTRPADAARDLEGLEVRVELTGTLTAARKKELGETIRARIQEYRKQAGLPPLPRPEGPKPAELKSILRKRLELPTLRWADMPEFPANMVAWDHRPKPPRLTPKEEALVAALNRSVKLEIRKQPLRATLEKLEKDLGISIELDEKALREAKLSADLPVSMTANDQSLRMALKKLLGDAGLVFVIRPEGLRVTTPPVADDFLSVRSHYVGDLIRVEGLVLDKPTSQMTASEIGRELARKLQALEPKSWEANGGKGTIVFVPPTMSFEVKQTVEMHMVLQGRLR